MKPARLMAFSSFIAFSVCQDAAYAQRLFLCAFELVLAVFLCLIAMSPAPGFARRPSKVYPKGPTLAPDAALHPRTLCVDDVCLIPCGCRGSPFRILHLNPSITEGRPAPCIASFVLLSALALKACLRPDTRVQDR